MKKIIRYFSNKNHLRAFAIGWGLLIFIISTIPNLPQPAPLSEKGITIRFDYIFHVSVFFVLGFFVAAWQTNSRAKIPERKLAFLITAGILFGLIDEYHQILIPGRRFNPVDFYLNSIGYVFGLSFTYYYLIYFLIRKKAKWPELSEILFPDIGES